MKSKHYFGLMLLYWLAYTLGIFSSFFAIKYGAYSVMTWSFDIIFLTVPLAFLSFKVVVRFKHEASE